MEHVTGDVSTHIARSPLAVVQAASQFNCLEFPSPNHTPHDGVTGYVTDRTQGPACSVAAGPATVYRNYFAPVRDWSSGAVIQEGQTPECQINNLAEICHMIGNEPDGRFFSTKNGYTMGNDLGLGQLNKALESLGREELKSKLRVGVHSDVQVTSSRWGKDAIEDPDHVVTEVFCSACSVNYSRNSTGLWDGFASMVLEASYEATLWAALLHALRYPGDPRACVVYLTAVGGGVFGNRLEWIEQAVDMACERVAPACGAAGITLHLKMVSYSEPVDECIRRVVQKWNPTA
jgi:hypothetical protein